MKKNTTHTRSILGTLTHCLVIPLISLDTIAMNNLQSSSSSFTWTSDGSLIQTLDDPTALFDAGVDVDGEAVVAITTAVAAKALEGQRDFVAVRIDATVVFAAALGWQYRFC